MPVDLSLYPPNWHSEIRPRILARAGEVRNQMGRVIQHACCEWCGLLNHSYVQREGKATLSRIVLTIAHLDDADPQNCADTNLAALCQQCHNQHDAPMRAQHAASTRAAKKEAEG